MPRQLGSEPREVLAPAHLLEERCADDLLELLELNGNRRLGDVDLGGGVPEMQVPRRRIEDPQLAQRCSIKPCHFSISLSERYQFLTILYAFESVTGSRKRSREAADGATRQSRQTLPIRARDTALAS